MTVTELAVLKMDFIKSFLAEENEDIVREQMLFLKELRSQENLAPIPSTLDEIRMSVKQGMDDYRNRQVISQQDLEQKIELW